MFRSRATAKVMFIWFLIGSANQHINTWLWKCQWSTMINMMLFLPKQCGFVCWARSQGQTWGEAMMLQFWSFQTRWNASSFPRVGWNHGMLELEQLAGLKKVGIFVWFPSCVGSEWISRGFRKFTTWPGFGSLICISALRSKLRRSIDVDGQHTFVYLYLWNQYTRQFTVVI